MKAIVFIALYGIFAVGFSQETASDTESGKTSETNEIEPVEEGEAGSSTAECEKSIKALEEIMAERENAVVKQIDEIEEQFSLEVKRFGHLDFSHARAVGAYYRVTGGIAFVLGTVGTIVTISNAAKNGWVCGHGISFTSCQFAVGFSLWRITIGRRLCMKYA
ncbi:MAG: hypothetical protein GF418_14615 [Chitinivibrionales bacterium]|nr:hypothetical protein [Chitinivibrionales bacterium]MBD3396853.1 hypothetical protein [Chitinivibrionales bacterium]